MPINVKDIAASWLRIESVAEAHLELQVPDYASTDSFKYDRDQNEFVLTYSYEATCDCCDYDFREVEITLDEVQVLIDGGTL